MLIRTLLAWMICGSLYSYALYSLEKITEPSAAVAPVETLTLSGVLQVDWSHFRSSPKDLWHGNEYTVQLDLMLDYKNETSWASSQFEFENPAGIQHIHRNRHERSNRNMLAGSGEGDNLYVVKAFMGYRLIDSSTFTLDYELGRHYLSDLFDSEIEFNNQFDGMLFRYMSKDKTKNGLELTVGSFVVDYRSNYFGYAGELDLFNTAQLPLDLKYSLITWDKKGRNAYGVRHPRATRFIDSQILAIYHFPHSITGYAAFLRNLAAKPNRHTKHTTAANGGYAGVTFGEVAKKNDMSFDMNYQVVQAQAIPESDVAGIGSLSPRGSALYSHTFGGITNYKGYIATFVYALTDHMNLQVLYQKAKPANSNIGKRFKMSTFEVTVIYTF